MHNQALSFVCGDGLLGRVIDPAGEPLDGQGALMDVCPLPLPPLASFSIERPLWETGIKVIDFFAPMPRGGVVALLASPGVGLMVAIAELTQRLAAERGGCMLMAKLDDELSSVAETVSLMREGGVDRSVVIVAAQAAAPAAQHELLVQAALAAAEEFAVRQRDVLLVIDDGLLTARTAALLKARARASAAGSLTLLLCFWRHATPEPQLDPPAEELLAAADTRLVFSRELALQGIWPAIDPLASRSQPLEDGAFGEAHREATEAAKALLRQLEFPEGSGDPVMRARAERVRQFGGQPFVVAEPYTAKPGVHVPYAETLRAYIGLTVGTYDHLDAAAGVFERL